MLLKICVYIIVFIGSSMARRHHLVVRDDVRRYIALSTFGFYQGGILDVKLHDFQVDPDRENEIFGLTLDKTMSDAMNPFLDEHQDKCILWESAADQRNGPIAFLTMDLKNLNVKVTCSKDWHNIHIYKDRSKIPAYRTKRQLLHEDGADIHGMLAERQKRNVEKSINDDNNYSICNHIVLPMTSYIKDGATYYNMTFTLYIVHQKEQGLHNLYFHSCPNYKRNLFALNFDVDIEENNMGNYLSAGEMPLPSLYFMMSLLFFLSGLFWLFLLKKSTHTVFRIHYIMGVLVFLKSLSLLFHSINFHFIEVKGEHIEAWAILYYITHLLKGAVLFITIVLIGTGWTFIKHILADKDKKLFMIVIPLQILANVAEIIIAESEEGDIERRTWRDIFMIVDLICCGAILFPVVWSIRHLQEASNTDGKAATNLVKLKLFRQFYIMIVCYIYFTRIIVYLLKVTVAFQYVWLDEMFKEMATYVFYVLTGYKFRPMPSHPYFSVDTDDEQEDEVLTESGLTQGLHKTKAVNRTMLTSVAATSLLDGNDDEKETLIANKESSHEYD